MVTAVALALLAQSCAAPQAAAPRAVAAPSGGEQIAVRNPGFEESPLAECATGWGCSAHAGPGSFRYFHDEANPGAGKRSFCIERIADVQPWAKVAQGVRYAGAPGRRLRFSGLIRTDAVKGRAGPLVVVQGGGGEILATAAQPFQGDTRWGPFAVEFDVPPRTTLIEVGVSLESDGRVCFDDVRLEAIPAAPGKV